MIRKVSGGYKVYSESGKPLSKTYATRKGAENRLAQVHYYSKKR